MLYLLVGEIFHLDNILFYPFSKKFIGLSDELFLCFLVAYSIDIIFYIQIIVIENQGCYFYILIGKHSRIK